MQNNSTGHASDNDDPAIDSSMKARHLSPIDDSSNIGAMTTRKHLAFMRSWYPDYQDAVEASDSDRPYMQGQRLSTIDRRSIKATAGSSMTYDYTSHDFSKNGAFDYGAIADWMSLPQSYEPVLDGRRLLSLENTIAERTKRAAFLISEIDQVMDGRSTSPMELDNRLNTTLSALLLADQDEKSELEINEESSAEQNEEERGAELSDDESSTESISDFRAAFDERVKPLLARDPELAGRLIHRIVPILHFLGPLFIGDGILSLINGDAANDGGAEQAPRSGPSSSPQTTTNGSSSTAKTKGGSSKRPKDQQDDDDGGKKRRRKQKDPVPPSGPAEKNLVGRKLKCVFCAKDHIKHCFKDERPSNDSGFSDCHYMQAHLDKYHTVVWCQKCHEVFIDDSEDNGDNDAVDRKIAHQKACNAPALPPVDDIIDCDMQAKLHKKLKNYKTPAWELENEDDDMKKWVSTYIGPFTGITKPTADLSVVELKNLRKGRRELAKWYIYWRTLFLRLPHPNPLYDRNISSLRNKQRLVEVYGYVVDSIAECRPPPSSVGGIKVFSQECLAILFELVRTLESSTTTSLSSISEEQVTSLARELMPTLALDVGTIQRSAETQEEYRLAFPDGHILVDPPESGDQSLRALHALRNSIFYQYLDLPAPTMEHLHDLALNGNVAGAIRDTGEAVDENSFTICQVAGILQQYGEEHGRNMQLAVHRVGAPSYIQTREGPSRTLWIHHEGNHYTAMAAKVATARETPRNPSRHACESAILGAEQIQDLPPEDASTSPQGARSDSTIADAPCSTNNEVTSSRSTVQSPVPSSPTNHAQDTFLMPEASYDKPWCDRCKGYLLWEDSLLERGEVCFCPSID